MSNQPQTLVDRVQAAIIQRNADLQEKRTQQILTIFSILSGQKDCKASIKNRVISCHENRCLLDQKHGWQSSLIYCVVSTPYSPCKKDWSFGTHIVSPLSSAVEEFMIQVPWMYEVGLIKPEAELKRYTEIICCPSCGKPIIGEFGFFVSNSLYDITGPEGANIRIFAIETYTEKPCARCNEEIDSYFKDL